MQQYMIQNECFKQDSVTFSSDDLHHIFKVMRCNVNDQVEVLNIQTSKKYLVKLNDDKKSATIVEEITFNRDLFSNLTLAYGLVKADKLEFVLQKASELGVTKFIPLKMDHSIIKYDEKKLASKRVRWEKIVKEACEQAHRNSLMKISDPMSVKQLLQESYDIKLVAYEKASLSDKIRNHDLSEKNVIVVIGPEGGISLQEIDLLTKADYQIVTLGKRVLRTETAVISALSIITDLME
jgi:16S rRNA (uracil1498-N3)-methyltransferase